MPGRDRRRRSEDRSRSRDRKPAEEPAKEGAVDRKNMTPFLLRIFYKFGSHHSLSAFAVRGQEPADEELQVYVWMDCTLGDLCDLLRDVLPEAADAKALDVNLVYPDKSGKMVFYQIGEVGFGQDADQRTLEEVKMQTGDFLDIAVN
jgi:histone deacetylase complex subunit SAP18